MFPSFRSPGRAFRRWPVLAVLLCACGGGDSTGPAVNQAPVFLDLPRGTSNGSLRNVVDGDEIGFEARGIDRDVEDITYRWEVVPPTGGGSFLGGDTATPIWRVGKLTGPVRIRCVISDGKDETAAEIGRDFSPGSKVSGPVIASNATWDQAGSPWIVIGDLTVASGVRLDLAAGVEVQMRAVRDGTGYAKPTLLVEGELVASGIEGVGQRVTIHGAYTEFPETGSDQFRGVEVSGSGTVELDEVLLEEATTGLRIGSSVASSVQNCTIRNSGTGVLVSAGTMSVLRGCAIQGNAIGVQLNSAGLSMENNSIRDNSIYGVDGDASAASLVLSMQGGEFTQNTRSHIRLRWSGANTVSATIQGVNFFANSAEAPSIVLGSPCFGYTLELRGNFWSAAATPLEILQVHFEGGVDCGVGVSGWTDSACEAGDPGTCDWSASRF